MYCKNCGEQIDDDSKFCNFCGKRQTPKKIVVEINEPSLPNQDSIRNAIFATGRFLKKALLALKPLVIKIIICCIIIAATYFSTYYSYYFLNEPPEASKSEIQLYREKGVTETLRERYAFPYGDTTKISDFVRQLLREKGLTDTLQERNAAPYGDITKISEFVYDYVNPSDILSNCKWDLDDELMDYPGCFNEKKPT